MDPNKTYGALYHLVATYSVITISFSYLSETKLLARPKSQILILQSLLIKIFEGFRSLCITEAECKYFMPLMIWYRMNLWWISLSIFCPMALCKSAYINSNTK